MNISLSFVEKSSMLPKLPNILSCIRIFSIPFVVLSFFLNTNYSNWLCLGIFSFACVTDFLDGYLARKFEQTSRLGQSLDIVADKLLVSSILLMLAGFDKIHKISLIPMIVILCREFIVSSMREYLMEKRDSEQSCQLSVSYLAKWKTTIQMFAIGFLIVGNKSNYFYFTVNIIGEILLWIAASITMYTAWSYAQDFIKNANFDD